MTRGTWIGCLITLSVVMFVGFGVLALLYPFLTWNNRADEK